MGTGGEGEGADQPPPVTGMSLPGIFVAMDTVSMDMTNWRKSGIHVCVTIPQWCTCYLAGTPVVPKRRHT